MAAFGVLPKGGRELRDRRGRVSGRNLANKVYWRVGICFGASKEASGGGS